MSVKDEIHRLITRCVRERGDALPGGGPWRDPLLGVAAAGDPGFARLARAVRPSHGQPGELLLGARSVLVFFLPFSPRLGAGNRPGRQSSAAWARAYLDTNALIPEIGRRVARLLATRGEATRVMPATHNFDPDELVSDWSHRHVAHIAGLGTFGLNNMLITGRGCCGRLGSLVTTAGIPPDPRPEEEACLHRRGGSCGMCLDRCVNDALAADAFHRRRCYEMCLDNARTHAALGSPDVCGKCMVKLPCSHTWPRGTGSRSGS